MNMVVALGLEGPLARAKCGSITIEVYKGDITQAEIEAIVNPANSLMIMGGGVAGAIRRAGGEEIEAEARKYAPVPVGKAIVTGAGKLQPRVRYVIHAPTMERPAMRTTREKVEKATRAALEAAASRGIREVALPAMGAGVGGLDVKTSMEAMLDALESLPDDVKSKIQRIVFVGYRDADAKKMVEVLKERASKRTSCIELT